MNVNGMNGKQFVYSEMGVKWLVTQLEHDVKGDQHHFKYRVDAIIYDGGMPQPPIGHVTSVMSTEGYEHYAGWRVEEYEPDPFEEREYPLRKGSIIRSPEGILASRSFPGSIPITTDAWAEINDVLDAYGDALDRIEKLQGMVDKSVKKALARKKALEKIADISSVDGAGRDMNRINTIAHESLTENFVIEKDKEKSSAHGTEEQQ